MNQEHLVRWPLDGLQGLCLFSSFVCVSSSSYRASFDTRSTTLLVRHAVRCPRRHCLTARAEEKEEWQRAGPRWSDSRVVLNDMTEREGRQKKQSTLMAGHAERIKEIERSLGMKPGKEDQKERDTKRIRGARGQQTDVTQTEAGCGQEGPQRARALSLAVK